MSTSEYQVTGMTCGHCEMSVREEVGTSRRPGHRGQRRRPASSSSPPPTRSMTTRCSRRSTRRATRRCARREHRDSPRRCTARGWRSSSAAPSRPRAPSSPRAPSTAGPRKRRATRWAHETDGARLQWHVRRSDRGPRRQQRPGRLPAHARHRTRRGRRDRDRCRSGSSTRTGRGHGLRHRARQGPAPHRRPHRRHPVPPRAPDAWRRTAPGRCPGSGPPPAPTGSSPTSSPPTSGETRHADPDRRRGRRVHPRVRRSPTNTASVDGFTVNLTGDLPSEPLAS